MIIKLNFASPALQAIFTLLKTATPQVRLIGGCVRDALLQLPTSDYDIATDLLPEEVIMLAKKAGYKAIPTGIDFGTVTVVVDKIPFEITTLREDIECFGRKAEVKFSTDFSTDAARRDFTINALSYDLKTAELFDYFKGYEDLKNQKVKFIGEASQRIQEDYLRIMRFFRFSAYYGKQIDKDGLNACKHHSKQLKFIACERIHQELVKLLKSPNNLTSIFTAMVESQVWQAISPKLNLDTKWLKSPLLLNNYSTNINFIKLALLLALNPISDIMTWLKELKFSNWQQKFIRKALIFISELHIASSAEEINFVLNKARYYDKDHFEDYWLIAKILTKIPTYYSYPPLEVKLPVKSEELVKLGFTGAALGEIIKQLEHDWIKSNFTLSKENLLNTASPCD